MAQLVHGSQQQFRIDPHLHDLATQFLILHLESLYTLHEKLVLIMPTQSHHQAYRACTGPQDVLEGLFYFITSH